jgi:class 3 adenylate cyclase
MKVRGRILVIVGMMPVWFAIAYGSFLLGVWSPVAAPVGTGLLSLVVSQFFEQRERQALMNLFEINLSPELASFVWKHKSELLVEGQIRPHQLTATLLFADIRGFASISEALPSEVLLPWLNRYFEVMTECIMDQGGIVDKYIGDSIMAAFGAPVDHAGEEAVRHDAIAAVQASLCMMERLKDLNQEFASQGLPEIRFGIGLHTGSLMAGTVGSRCRSSYSLFGDTVNVASRLQDKTKTLTQNDPYPILLSEATYQYVRQHFMMLNKGQVLLRGRTEQTTVYTPLDVPSSQTGDACSTTATAQLAKRSLSIRTPKPVGSDQLALDVACAEGQGRRDRTTSP